MDVSVAPLISEFPTEILQHIYKFLPTIQVIKCREVSVWWKQTVDGMLQSDEAWLKICRRDFTKLYKDARLKSPQDLSWRELYKSLHVWPKLKHAKETWFELANVVQRDEDHIITMHAWNGSAAAQTDQRVVYYNLETLQPDNFLNIGKFKMFEENEHVMVYMLYTHFHMLWFRNLKIVPKLKGIPSFEKEIEIENVNNFVLVDLKIFYNKWSQRREGKFIEVYVCNVSDDLKCSIINRINSGVWAFGYNEELLNFITVDDTIYTLVDKEFVMSDRVTDEDCFYKLCKHNLVERANFYGWIMDALSITSRSNYLEGLTVRLWGDIALVGNEKGQLKIYQRHLLCNKNHAKPIRKYDLKSIFKLTNTEINGIDLVPVKNGHIVLISTPCKIMALSLQAKSRKKMYFA